MMFLAILIGMRLALGTFGVMIVPFGFKISFAWLAVYVCGFFYGPIIGLTFGFLMDTISFFIFGGVWFWMYAIQEPIVGLLAGIVGSFYFLELFKSIKWQIIIQKIFTYLFICFTIVIVIIQFFAIENARFQIAGLTNLPSFAIVVLVMMSIFLIVNEVQNWWYYRRIKLLRYYNEYSLYLYVSFLMILCTVLFSFLLGPISYVKYLEYVNGVRPSQYLQYGNMYYLVPRVLKESIKTPLYIIIFVGIVFAIKTPFKNFFNISINRW